MKSGFEFQDKNGDTVVASFDKVVRMTMEKVGEKSHLAITFFHPWVGASLIEDAKEMERVLEEYKEWLEG